MLSWHTQNKDRYVYPSGSLSNDRLTSSYCLAVDEGTQAGVADLMDRKSLLFGCDENGRCVHLALLENLMYRNNEKFGESVDN